MDKCKIKAEAVRDQAWAMLQDLFENIDKLAHKLENDLEIPDLEEHNLITLVLKCVTGEFHMIVANRESANESWTNLRKYWKEIEKISKKEEFEKFSEFEQVIVRWAFRVVLGTLLRKELALLD